MLQNWQIGALPGSLLYLFSEVRDRIFHIACIFHPIGQVRRDRSYPKTSGFS